MIDLAHVTKRYANGGSAPVAALDDVTLRVGPGEFVAVVGKSGSGKSTLLNLVAGIDRPDRGEIRIAGTSLAGKSESRLAQWRGRTVGVIFQSFQLLPTLTVAENVMLPIDFCGTLPPARARERAHMLLERVGIRDQADKLPLSLSGGQQQRAAIARALASDPPLVLADEPTGNLDSHTAALVLDCLQELVSLRKTVLIVTHERDIAAAVDRVVTLADGRLVSDHAGGRTSRAQQERAAHVPVN